jgi:hypothetical protein
MQCTKITIGKDYAYQTYSARRSGRCIRATVLGIEKVAARHSWGYTRPKQVNRVRVRVYLPVGGTREELARPVDIVEPWSTYGPRLKRANAVAAMNERKRKLRTRAIEANRSNLASFIGGTLGVPAVVREGGKVVMDAEALAEALRDLRREVA